ncbi:LysR family transcriptional regulator [Achromobacter xylosoxidans]|uniref:LysR family transcriptional regulator n=1 Tax=Alcaligenes xylosoxydans xylosoxydans TaxID=85698 RepID=UPI001F1322FA|nr:LysR family transcriptional regulator [Achromobacter xylosoxidans]
MKHSASITQVSVFVKIVELGSLAAAAKELEVTPSAVSKSLAQLEQRLGVLLLKRTTRSLTLTEMGKVIFEQATAILSEVENTLNAARQHQHPSGNIRISSSLAFGTKRLPSLITAYLKAYPDVDAHLALDDRMVNLAEDGCDIALRITASTDWGYAARRLATINWVYCSSPGYLAEAGPISSPEDLETRDCLVYPAMTLGGKWVFEGVRAVQVTVRSRLVSNSSLALRDAALSGLGVACLPTYLVCDDVVAGDLVIVAPDYRCAITHHLYAMYYRSRYVNPVVRSFIDFLVAKIGDIPPWDTCLTSGKTTDFMS